MSALTDSILKGSATQTPVSGGSSLVSQILSQKQPAVSSLVQNPQVAAAIQTFAPGLLAPKTSIANSTTPVPNQASLNAGSFGAGLIQAPFQAAARVGVSTERLLPNIPGIPKSDLPLPLDASGNYTPTGGAQALLGEKPLATTNQAGAMLTPYLGLLGIKTNPGFYTPALGVASTLADILSLPIGDGAKNFLARGLSTETVKEAAPAVENAFIDTAKPSEVARSTGRTPAGEIIPQTARIAPKIEGSASSKVGQSIESGAIEKKLTEGFGGTAGYDPIVVKEQAQNVSDLINKDVNSARAMVRGEVPLPENIRGAALITGMEDYAVKNGDSEMLRELAQSPLASETSRSAQELRLLAERSPDSPVSALKDIANTREAMASKRYGNLAKAKDTVSAQIKKEIATTRKKETWESFINSIQC